MSLYDIIDEITERQVTKTETGETRAHGVMVGTVTKNYDDSMGGRVCVSILTRDTDANELQWARMASAAGGKSWGHYFLPEVGDQVLLAFENGNIECPYIIGCVNKDNDSFLTGSVDKDNQYKRIVTKHGSTIIFEDNANDEDGAKDKITIQTAGKAHTILMDNENCKIRIGDKKGEDYIEMKTNEGSGTLTVNIKSKITIKVGDTITLTMNGESGAVKLEASTINMEASQKILAKTDGTVQLEGTQIKEKAGSMHKIESAGMVNVSGSPIKIG